MGRRLVLVLSFWGVRVQCASSSLSACQRVSVSMHVSRTRAGVHVQLRAASGRRLVSCLSHVVFSDPNAPPFRPQRRRRRRPPRAARRSDAAAGAPTTTALESLGKHIASCCLLCSSVSAPDFVQRA